MRTGWSAAGKKWGRRWTGQQRGDGVGLSRVDIVVGEG